MIILAFSAAASDGIRLGNIGRQTATDRVAGWQDRALSVGTTWRGVARIRFWHTLVVLANITGTTIRITFTFAFASGNCIRHWDEARQTTADRVAKAVLHAHGVGSARGGVTGVGALDALVVGAHVATTAVRVGVALTVTSGYGVRFGDEARVTLTDRVSTLVCTESVGSTWRWITGVGTDNTSLVLAYIPLVTVRIPHTFRTTSCDGVRFRYKARFTSTNRVTTKVYCTYSSWATWRGIARVGLLHTSLVLANIALATVRVNYTLGFAA